MSITYTPATNFGAKDSLPTNDPDKVIKGSEFSTEFVAIQTAFGLAAPAASPTFTGTVTIASVDINGGAIDGTTIGGTTPAAGTFSSLTATTADINGGTIDGVTIGGASAGAGTFTTLNATGGGALTGTWTDLGSVTTVDINGGTIDGVTIGGSSAGAGSFTTLTASGDVNFDSGTLFVDASADSVGIGTSSPSANLEILNTSVPFGTTGTIIINGQQTNQASGSIIGQVVFQSGASSGATGPKIASVKGPSNSDSVLAFQTNNTERMRINNSYIGVNVTDPNVTFQVRGTGDFSGIQLASAPTTTTQSSKLQFATATSGQSYVVYNNGGDLLFNSSATTGDNVPGNNTGTERMRITSAGNVGIGTSSPNRLLTISASSATAYDGTSSAQSGATLAIANINNTTSNTFADIQFTCHGTSTGFARIGMELPAVNRSELFFNTQGSSGIAERMRIDDSGRLLVGKTATNFATEGVEIGGADGKIFITRDNVSLYLNRLSSDGNIAEFYKNGSKVGAIGTVNNYMHYASAYCGFSPRVNDIVPTNSAGALNDNAIDLGDPAARMDDIYATNGTIQTSDRNEKENIRELLEAEARVAQAAKGLLRAFQWKDSVAGKGDDARIHFGIIAQDLQAAFEAEGLDAGRYAMFIHSTWTDEETGEERSRMGVRYSELLAFIIAAL